MQRDVEGKGDFMAVILQFHRPIWRGNETGWEMLAGNRLVAGLMPVECRIFLQYKWLSWVHPDFDDHGWSNVDFASVEEAQYMLGQWWAHLCRGERYLGESD
jgi:hypothetical protein